MPLEIKWIGIDFGQCLMDPSGLRNYLVIGDVCKMLGQPEMIQERIDRYHALKEKYQSYGALKEGHRDKIYRFVFDDHPLAPEFFSKKEQEHLRLGRGAEEALKFFQAQGLHVSVVAELKKTLGPMNASIVGRFVETKGLVKYFEDIVTPQGRWDLKTGGEDLRYKGRTKESGTLYDLLAEDLLARGIETSQGVMVGDKGPTDIIPAKKRGFNTVQYIGYIDYGPCGADYRISDFRQLIDLIKKV